MQQFIDKLIGRLEEVIDGLEVYTAGRANVSKVNISVLQMQRYINRLKEVNQLAEEYKPRTNADIIRNMTDEELAELFELQFARTECLCCYKGSVTCKKCWSEWLQSEVEGGEEI